ncbi:MAG: ribose-phosphate pyrophosphokinase [Elusimicrobia bacterium]|nr:ribose-phosphate pyrophosphokinase [Elusimicrobiota bacterium]
MPFTTGKIGSLKVFSGNSNLPLAREICKLIKVPLGKMRVGRFADGEVDLQILENVRGCDCYIVQPACPPINESMMELLIAIDALKRASAGRITVVIPYYGYGRADRKTRSRVPITAKLLANLISSAGANRAMAIDLHAGQIQGFFDIPMDNLQASPVFAHFFNSQKLGRKAVVSPDVGGVERARLFVNRLNGPAGLVIVDKRRPKPNEAVVYNVIGSVKDCTAIILDDIVDTAGTLVCVANALKQQGAKRVFAACTHGLLSENAIERVKNSPIEKLLITNTIRTEKRLTSKIKQVSVAPILAEAVRRNHFGLSISEMFK